MSLMWRLATERAKREAQLQRLEALLATPDDRAALRARARQQAEAQQAEAQQAEVRPRPQD
ncbi:hypothetical protein [Vulcanococcus sp.]|jgi:Trp operon repressor|uniref:hypothetical protein n=1 Tax=Vulcanococcus sp. TaxID=2856995 RepID=UPI0037DA217A